MATVTPPRAGEAGAGGALPPLTADDVDPLLLQLGTLVGLLDDAGDGTYTIDAAWFDDPWTQIKAIPSERAGDLLAVLETLVGTAAPGAIGQPHTEDGMLWYPLLVPGLSTAAGDSPLYLVAPPPGAPEPIVVGLGARYTAHVDGVGFSAYAHLPLLQLGGGEIAQLVLGTGLPSTPAQVGLEVTGVDLAAGAVQCAGLQFRCSIALTGGTPELDLVFLQLQLPGQSAPSDQTLDAVIALGAGEWIATAVSLVANQLATLAPASKPIVDQMTAATLALLGITPGLPAPDWDALFEDPSKALLDWAGAIAATSPTLEAWLIQVAALLDPAAPPPANATGTGTRSDPFTVPLADVGPVAFALTVAAQVDDTGSRHVYPGLALGALPPVPAGLGAIALELAIAAELADLVVPTPAARRELVALPHLPLPSLAFTATLRSAGDGPLFSVPDPTGPAGSTLSLGSGVAGLRYDGAAGALAPVLELRALATGYGSWPVIDFTSVDATVNQLEAALATVVTGALERFFGLSDADDAPTGPLGALAALLGLVAPPGHSGAWPIALLLDGDGIEAVLAGPLDALAGYYGRALGDASTCVPPLLGALATLLGSSDPAPAGSGTLIDPWRATVLDAGDGLTACVTAWSPAAGALRVGIAAAFAPALAEAELTAELDVGVVDVRIPATGAPSAGWLPGVAASVAVTGPGGAALETTPLGGIGLSLTRAGLAAGWSARDGWYGVVELDGAELVGGGLSVPLDLPVLDVVPSAWTPAQFAQLAGAALNVLGLSLLEHGGRAGVALTTVLGLLPDLPAVFAAPDPVPFPRPAGFVLPEPWPVLVPSEPETFFTAPWHDVQGQLAAVLATPACGQAAATLLGWALSGSAVSPAPPPAGTAADPYVAALGGTRPAALLAWGIPAASGKAPAAAGLGLEVRLATQPATALALSTVVRVDVLAVALGGTPATPPAPALDLLVALTSPQGGGPLVDDPATGLRIGSAELGVSVTATGVAPVATFLDATPGTGIAAGTYDLALALESSLELQRIASLVGAAFALLSAQAEDVAAEASPLHAGLDLLAALDLATSADDGIGIAIASWIALLADPQQYATDHLTPLLADPDAAARVLGDAATLLGFPGAQAGDGVRCALTAAAALGLGAPSAAGPLPSVAAVLALLRDPIGSLRSRLEALFADPDAVKQLVNGLTPFASAGPLPLPIPGVTVSAENATSVTLATSATALGGELSLAGSITLDATRGAVAVDLVVGSATAGMAVALDADVAVDAASWSLALTVPEQHTPAPFEPIRLVGSAGGIDPAVAAVAIPTLVLSNVAAALLNTYVLASSPLASRLAVALRLAEPPAKGEPARIASLAGVAIHPASWLDGALGDGTAVDLAKLGPLLAALAGDGVDGPGGITLKAVGTTGLTASGLPYDTSVTLTATADGLTLAPAFGSTLDGVKVAFAPGLTYAPPAGVSVSGTVSVQATVDPHTFSIDAGYQGGAFTLAAGTGTTTFQLVPFAGFNQYVEAATACLLEYAAEEAIAAYEHAQPSAEVKALVDALQAVAAAVGITSVATLVTEAKQIVEDPLGWLATLEGNAQELASAIAALLGGTLGVPGVSATGGLVDYTPSLGGGAAVTAAFGFDPTGHLGVWLHPGLTVAPLSFDASAGVSIAVPVPKPVAFDLTVAASIAIQDVAGLPGPPTLSGKLDLTGGGATFDAHFYPCGPPTPAAAAAPEQPALELLPSFALTAADGTPIALAEWLEDAAFACAIPVLGALVLNLDAVKGFLTKPVVGTASLATIAEQLGVLATPATPTAPLVPADPRIAFGGLTPEAAVAKVLGTALESLEGLDLLPGSLPARAKVTGADGTYGLSIAIPGIVVSGADGRSTKVTLQLGAWPSGDTAPYWVARSLATAPDASTPGIDVALVTVTGTAMTFAPALALVSVGIDVTGAGPAPLLDVAGCTLGGVEARIYAAFSAQAWSAGGALRIDDLAIPLGPKLGEGGNANPIAENLLSSGGSDDAVNPAVSAMVAIVEPYGTLDVQLVGNQPGDTATHLAIPIQRGLGPLYCQQIVLDWLAGELLGVGFDGSVSLAGLSVGVQGLEVTIPVTTPLDHTRYGLDLAGLEIAFQGGPVAIDGGLIRTEDKTGLIEYTGGLSARAEQFGLTVLGSYAVVGGQPSMFAFGLLAAPIGGPPCFFVTGIAAGFGYNRALRLPGQDEITEFPLVAGVIDPEKFFPDWQSSPGTALEALDDWVKPQVGQYWLAAGVQFTSFELLQSFALLAIEFGAELEIALIGVSTLEVPSQGGAAVPPIARATLELEAVFKPSSGTFAVTAVLAPDSYVLDPNAHLTGGFAFQLWWAGEHAGQFVLTVGGYSPRFEPPDYYPQEQRLGLSWSLGAVQLTGGAYFALTPSAVMAGGELSLTYSAGDLKAWLDASADMLVRWKPFAFEVAISVSIGASYRVNAWFIHHTFTIELGATLELHGMPIGGRVEVHWYVISFSIAFGEQGVAAPPLDWADFATSFLPAGGEKVVTAAVGDGLDRTLDEANTSWLVAQRFTLVTTSLIPGTDGSFNGTAPTGEWAHALGVRPMQVAALASAHQVTLTDSTGKAASGALTVTPVTSNVPAALWSPDPQPQATPSNELVGTALTGLQITAASDPVATLTPIPLALLLKESSRGATWVQPPRPTGPTYRQTDVVHQIETALASTTAARTALVTALQPTFPELTDAVPTVLARFADQALQAPPLLVTLGAAA